MLDRNQYAKVNVKLLLILTVVTAALGMSLIAARQVRRSILAKVALTAAETAFQNQDWRVAVRNYRDYLGQNPNDAPVLQKYAQALLSIRPLDAAAITGTISAYRRILQLNPLDNLACAKLAMLYTGIGNAEELAYIARMRLEQDPNDRNAPLWLADALLQLNKQQEAQQTLGRFVDALETRPGKSAEHVKACARMSQILILDNSVEAKANALKWLNRAVGHDPNSMEALAHRARFYREASAPSDMNETQKSVLIRSARNDLLAADRQTTDDPRVRLALAAEWMMHGELDRAAAELQAADTLPQEKLQECYFDLSDWKVARFLFASELAVRRGALSDAITLTDEALTELTEKRHRVRVLPAAVRLYVAAGKAPEARKYLDEYLGVASTQAELTESKWTIALLQALVAKAEEKLYAVIDVLQPVVVSDASRPELWRLLAEAYSRTDQSRRAVASLINYLRYYPRDPEMTLQLAKEYLKLRDWNRAFETARLAEPLNPTDIILRLLRIEASIYLAAEERQTVDTRRLEALSAELANLRKDHPERVDVRILQSIIAVYLEQPDQAERELKLAMQECKEPLRAEMQLVRHYYRLKRTADAVALCRESCQRHPQVAEPWISLSGIYGATGDPNAARACLREGLQAATGKWEKRSVSVRLAQLELTSGDRAVGVRLLSEVAAQDEYEVYARIVLLSVREVRDDRAQAERLIKELRKAEGESGLWWRLHQASLYLSADDWRSKQQDVTGLLQVCVDSDPEWSTPVLLLTEMYEKLGDLRRVEDTCRQALVRNPSATDVADRLVTLLEKQGRLSDAQQVLQQVDADPRVARAWRSDRQILTALRAGDFSRAIDELKLRASNDNRDAESRILLARLTYWQTGDAAQALKYLQEAEAITPGSLALTTVKVSILRAEKRTQEAQQILDKYVTSRSDFSAYLVRAAYFTRSGELDRAEQDYRKLTTFRDRGMTGYELLSDFYFRTQKLDRAVATLEEGLNAYPGDLSLTRRLMKLLFLRGQAQDREKATGILTRLEQRLSQDPELMKIRAQQMLQESTPASRQAAKEKLETVVKLEPTAVDAHLMLIALALEEKENATARDLAVRALGSNPNNTVLLSARGKTELALDNVQMAVELAHLALRQDPNSPEASEVLAQAALIRQDKSLLEEARPRLESLVTRYPANEKLLLVRAQVLASLKQPEKAVSELEAYCQTKEGAGSVTALVMLADLYRLTGNADQSKRWIDQAERLDSGNQTVIHARMLWLMSQNRWDELKGMSATYLAAKAQDPVMLLRAASVLVSSNSAELKQEGLKLFERAAALAPRSTTIQLTLASTLYQMGDVDRARKIYEDLRKQDPGNAQVLNDLAWILQEHDHNYDAALELANKGLDAAPSDLHLLDTRGTILTNFPQRLKDARNDFQTLVNLAPEDSREKAKALLQLGRICIRLKDLAEAKRSLEKALQIDQKVHVFTPAEQAEIAEIRQKNGV